MFKIIDSTPTLYLLEDFETLKKKMEDNFYSLIKDIQEEDDKDSIFYGLNSKFTQDDVGIEVSLQFEEFGVNIYPIIDGEHLYDCGYGEDEYIAVLKNTEITRPSFTIFKELISKLLEPILNKVSTVDWSDIKRFCGNAQGSLNIELHK